MSKREFYRNHPVLGSIIYLFLYEGLIAMIIGAGSNFGIAWAMYAGHHKHYVCLWAFPHTLSGDCALSLFIQTLVTWFSEEFLINYDNYLGETCVLPKSFTDRVFRLLYRDHSMPQPTDTKVQRFWQWYFEVDRGMVSYRSQSRYDDDDEVLEPKLSWLGHFRKTISMYADRGTFKQFVFWVIQKALRAVSFGIPLFLVLWPITMGIMTGVGHKLGKIDYYYDTPAPEVMKLVYAGVIGWIATPAAIVTIILRNDFHERVLRARESYIGLKAPREFREEKVREEPLSVDLEKGLGAGDMERGADKQSLSLFSASTTEDASASVDRSKLEHDREEE